MSNKRYKPEETAMICSMSAAGATTEQIVEACKDKFQTVRNARAIKLHVINNSKPTEKTEAQA